MGHKNDPLSAVHQTSFCYKAVIKLLHQMQPFSSVEVASLEESDPSLKVVASSLGGGVKTPSN